MLIRPHLWVTTLAAIGRLAGAGWWYRWPYLPLPDGRLWAFRMETAYGRTDVDPEVDDVIAYLEWCRNSGSRPPWARMRRDGLRTRTDGDGGARAAASGWMGRAKFPG
ncbi:MAG TPA: hypothetical protein VG032_08800 [Acidimicrobiales bacterium]|nr:hypothetical protein [Acidimicrobiales bacterium]